MAITQRTLLLIAQMRAALAQIIDADVRSLVAAWADAWDEVAADLTATLTELAAGTADGELTRTLLMRSARLQQILGQVSDQLDTLTQQAGVTITGDLGTVVTTAAAAQAPIITSELPPGAGLVNPYTAVQQAEATLSAIVTRSTQQVISRLKPVAPETYQAIRRELLRGSAAGSSPRDTAARMVQRAEKRFNFGLTRALVIARTEMVDAHRAGAKAAQDQHADVLAGWIWGATLDAKTCPSCWAQNGILHPLDEPGPYDHQQGRCARIPKTKSWADLGFTGLLEPADATPDAATVFGSLATAEQIQILGPARHAAWVAGDFPMSDWSVKRTTSGWRDSYGVAPVPDGYRSSGGRSSTPKSKPGRRGSRAA